MELRDYLRILRHRWILIAVTAFVVVCGMAGYTYAATPEYQSSARLFITTSPSDTSDAYQGGLFSVQRVSSYSDLVKNSRELAQTVISQLDLNMSPDALLDKVQTAVVPDTVVLRISVTDSNPTLAKTIAQSYASNLPDLVRQLETPPGQTIPPIKATIVDSASSPGSPVSPRPVRNLGLAILAGLLLGVVAAFVREMLDNSVTSPEDVGDLLTAPVLGFIAYDATAKQTPLVTSLESHSPRVESFRVLRTNLQFVDVDSVEKVFVITSALPEEGKTSTAVNLAITLAQAGVRTLLIEGDLRRPRAHSALGLDGAAGVTTVLLGQLTLDEALQKHTQSDLHVLASGAIPPNPADLVQSNAMAVLLAEARARYEVVIIDAPPLLPVTDGALLASQADGALLVIRHGKTTKDQIKQSRDRLGQVDAQLVGAVLNMVPARALKGGYGYGYGYGYAPTPVANDRAGFRRAKSGTA